MIKIPTDGGFHGIMKLTGNLTDRPLVFIVSSAHALVVDFDELRAAGFQIVMDDAIVLVRLLPIGTMDINPIISRANQTGLKLAEGFSVRIEPFPVSCGGVPHADVQTIAVDLLNAGLEALGKAKRIGLEGIQPGGMHQAEHFGAVFVLRSVEIPNLRPHVVQNDPAHGNSLVPEFLTLGKNALLINPYFKGVPAAPPQILEQLGILPLMTCPAVGAKQSKTCFCAILQE